MMIRILSNLKSEKAFTVSAHDGMDEISLVEKTVIHELQRNNQIKSTVFDPRTAGFKLVDPEALKGGDSEMNAYILKTVLKGESDRSKIDIVILNSVYAIMASGKTNDMNEAIELAADSIDSGRAYHKLKEFITATNDLDN